MRMVRVIKLTAVLLALALSPWRVAQAEVTLTDWKTYAAMAEQGAVCGAFAHIMEMQSMVDEDLGQLWSERRNYAGSIVIRAAQLEGRTDVDADAVDTLLNRYSMWLLNNLASPEDNEILGSDARNAARDMIADVCTGLFAQADEAIFQKFPALGQCQAGTEATDKGISTPAAAPQSCIADTSGITTAAVKQAEQEAAKMLLQLQEEQQARTALSAANAALESDLTSVRNELETLRNNSMENGEAIGLADVKIKELNERNAELEALLSTAKTDLANSVSKNREATQKTEAQLLELASLNENLSTQLNATRKDIERLSNTAAANREISARNQELTDLLDAKQAELDKLTVTAAANVEIDERNAELQAKNQQLGVEVAELKEDLAVAMDMFEEAANRDPDADMRAELEFALAEMEALTTEKLILQSELDQVSRALDDAQATIELAATLQPAMPDYSAPAEESLPDLASDETVELAFSMDILGDEAVAAPIDDGMNAIPPVIDMIDANIIASARPVPSARVTGRVARQPALELASSELIAVPAAAPSTIDASQSSVDLTVTKTAQPDSIIMEPKNVKSALQPMMKTTQPKAAKPVLANGKPAFVAQLGTFRSRSSAMSEIAMLQQAFPSDLATAGLDVSTGRMANGKDVFRITTSQMSAEDASGLCDVLWNRMVGCMIKAAR